MTVLSEIPSVTRNLNLSIDDNDADVIFRALGNPQRLRILRRLGSQSKTVALLAQELDIPVSTINQHLRALEDAGLIRTDLRPATRGTEKVCAGVYKQVICDLLPGVELPERAVEIAMPIGAYVDFRASPTCGLASRLKIIGMQDDPEAFLEPERLEAQLLWIADGYVEYRFPKRLPPHTLLESLHVSMEICSETAGYNESWPSDITLWINDVGVGTWTSPGDMGSTRGLLNPDWWSSNNTQHGTLKSWKVNKHGSHIDGMKSSDVTLSELRIDEQPHIAVRVGVSPDAEHKGGFNLFGRDFGNYPQDLVLRLVYDKQRSSTTTMHLLK